ncbi:MAG TPA: hypothetical protein VN887_07995, partial [Candidatus Angelobacter sp.]|nr:hypothetical protein [Candidatus Angelobacter sp.]
MAASLIFGWQKIAMGQSDDFNDGNDTGWVHLDINTGTMGQIPSGASYTFPDDGFGGKAYRIQSPAPPVPDAGPARAFSYRTNVYDNFYLAADIVTFDNSLNQAFGFLVRADPGSIGLGTTTGYVLNYDPNQQNGERGQFQINVVTGEQPTRLIAANITLDPTHRYRFVMNGAASTLTGQIYDFADLTAPLVTISADDTTYPSGVLGLFNFSRVNAADYTNPATGKTDVTFDNYYASTDGPILVDFDRTPHPIPNMPQVANRTPTTRANFYGYTNGISFTATTMTTNAIDPAAIRLFLNGTDVSSTLTMSGPSNNVDVRFNGLMPNTVYGARIELSDFSGRATTNEFTFDTFDESYLDAPGVKVIEAEDYNYGAGQFQDDPPVSGLDSVGAQVNGSGVGYYDLIGAGGVDFFDFSTTPGSGASADYRTQDPVGTQAGSSSEFDNGVPTVINDSIRAKYASRDLSEYEVRGTEGGEWLDYTRIFSNATYNVYLREACRASQTVYLDRVTGDATQRNQTTVRLGMFNVPSTAMLINYSYTPLVDTNGNPAAISLSGTNTLRLTFGGPQTDA